MYKTVWRIILGVGRDVAERSVWSAITVVANANLCGGCSRQPPLWVLLIGIIFYVEIGCYFQQTEKLHE